MFQIRFIINNLISEKDRAKLGLYLTKSVCNSSSPIKDAVTFSNIINQENDFYIPTDQDLSTLKENLSD